MRPQVSEWYLDESILKENEAELRKEAAAATAAAAVGPVTPAKKVTKEKKKQ